MKRIIALAIALVMCIALTACGSSEKEELYDKYESIIRSLEKNDYDKALEKIEKLYKKHQESTSEKESGKDKFKDLVVGEWIISNYANDEAVGNITFTENGECTVGGETYSWKLDKDYKTWADFVISKDGDELYKFTLNDRTENENRLMASLWKLKGESENEYVGDFYSLAEYTVIELTADNFLDHFEKIEVVDIQKNAFGEPVEICVGYYYLLKEEYGKVEGDISKVAIEYTYVEPRYELLDADIASGTYEIGERIEDSYGAEENTSITNLSEIYDSAVGHRYGFPCGSLWINAETSYVYMLEIKEILRVSGSIYVLIEAE